jgi:hypothetical protein
LFPSRPTADRSLEVLAVAKRVFNARRDAALDLPDLWSSAYRRVPFGDVGRPGLASSRGQRIGSGEEVA